MKKNRDKPYHPLAAIRPALLFRRKPGGARARVGRTSCLPLAAKLWLAVSAFAIALILLMGAAFRAVSVYTRSETNFSSIETSRQLLKGKSETAGGRDTVPQQYDAIVSVYHIGIVDRQVKYMTFPASKFEGLSTEFLNIMGTSYSRQADGTKKYEMPSGGYTLYYVIEKSGKDGVISFRVGDSNQSVYRRSFYILLGLSAAAALVALLLARLFARSLTDPIRRLEKAAADMAEGNFDTPLDTGRGDELGKLACEIDSARRELKKRDFLRQSALQYISHELKTPVMTIGAYAQSILDRIYPRGDLDGSVRVIAEQAERLERIVRKLLMISHLDYLEGKPRGETQIDLAELVEAVAARVCVTRRDLDVRFDLADVRLTAPREETEVMIENLLENAARYAERVIRVRLAVKEGRPTLAVYNDGGGISPSLMPDLFEAFKKGKTGGNGLGLSIVKRTAAAVGAEVRAENVEQGVEFTVWFALSPGKKGV